MFLSDADDTGQAAVMLMPLVRDHTLGATAIGCTNKKHLFTLPQQQGDRAKDGMQIERQYSLPLFLTHLFLFV